MSQNNELDRQMVKLSEIIDQWEELEMSWYPVIERWIRMSVLTEWDRLEFHRGAVQAEDILKIFDQNFIDIVSFRRMLIRHRDYLVGEPPTKFIDVLLLLPNPEPIREEYRIGRLVRRDDVFRTAADKIRALNWIVDQVEEARQMKDKTTRILLKGVYDIDWLTLGLPGDLWEPITRMADRLSPATRMLDRLKEGAEMRMDEIRGRSGSRRR